MSQIEKSFYLLCVGTHHYRVCKIAKNSVIFIYPLLKGVCRVKLALAFFSLFAERFGGVRENRERRVSVCFSS